MKASQIDCVAQIAWLILLTVLSLCFLGLPPAGEVFLVAFYQIYQSWADN